jgi:hypothetical protein
MADSHKKFIRHYKETAIFFKKIQLLIWTIALLTACSATPPKNTENICAVFRQNDDWYEAAKAAYRRWGIPVPVQMAIMNQESSFVADAQPPRKWILGFIPAGRPTTAYGYAQAIDKTWENYQSQTGHWGADRDDFADSCDFIGWYCAISYRKLGVSPWDAQNLYLTYHEGHGGYQRKTYLLKHWLLNTSEKVAERAKRYSMQLAACQQELENQN